MLGAVSMIDQRGCSSAVRPKPCWIDLRLRPAGRCRATSTRSSPHDIGLVEGLGPARAPGHAAPPRWPRPRRLLRFRPSPRGNCSNAFAAECSAACAHQAWCRRSWPRRSRRERRVTRHPRAVRRQFFAVHPVAAHEVDIAMFSTRLADEPGFRPRRRPPRSRTRSRSPSRVSRAIRRLVGVR